MDFYMLCHAQAAKPVFPYGPFKLQCVFERSEIHTKGTSLPEAGINWGFSNSNYNRRAETSSGMSVWISGNLREAFTLTERQCWDGEGGIFMAIFCVNEIEYGLKKKLTLPSWNVG